MRRRKEWAPKGERREKPIPEFKPYRAGSLPCERRLPGCRKRAEVYLDIDARGLLFKGNVCMPCYETLVPAR